MSTLRTPARTSNVRAAVPPGTPHAAPQAGPRAAARALAQGLATLMEPVATPSLPTDGSAPPMARPLRPVPAFPDTRLPVGGTTHARGWTCACGRAAHFRQCECLSCLTPLGYDPETAMLLPLEPVAVAIALADDQPGAAGGLWRVWGAADNAQRFRRCANLDTAAACNWLVAEGDPHAGPEMMCRCCRLTRTAPDLSQEQGAQWWHRIEQERRRLVASLIALHLPVRARKGEDPASGLAFDLLRATPGGPAVHTGYADGVISIDIEEADDAWRAQRQALAGEPRRTLLAQLRHETGHYYWQRLVQPGRWLAPWRELFGDERRDRAAGLKKHCDSGPPADWSQRHVNAYASSHPLEDWAETWAHYLAMTDGLALARDLGLDTSAVEPPAERYGSEMLSGSGDARPREFLQMCNRWAELNAVLDEMGHGMGITETRTRALPGVVVRKLHLVHRVIGHAHVL